MTITKEQYGNHNIYRYHTSRQRNIFLYKVVRVLSEQIILIGRFRFKVKVAQKLKY